MITRVSLSGLAGILTPPILLALIVVLFVLVALVLSRFDMPRRDEQVHVIRNGDSVKRALRFQPVHWRGEMVIRSAQVYGLRAVFAAALIYEPAVRAAARKADMLEQRPVRILYMRDFL